MKVRLFVNEQKISEKNLLDFKTKLLDNGFEIVENGYEIAIAIGGDGTFLRMVKETNFASDIAYVGINCGTLGFLQEVKFSDIDIFIEELKKGYYRLDEIGIQETMVEYQDGIAKFYSLNEIVIRRANLKAIHLDISIEKNFLEHFMGDGILIASSIGSTAYNLSVGGSIVYDTFSTLQMTPLAPINTQAYKTIFNSIILPSQKEIILKPHASNQDIIIIIDGEITHYQEVSKITTKIDTKKIKLLRLSHYNFPQKINEKLLSHSDLS